MDEVILEAVGLRHAYPGGVEALRGIDLTITRGRRLALLGPNGCGKTTLFLHLNGTLRPGAGKVLLGGAPAGYDRRSLRDWRSRVSLVLQDPDDQIFAATVARDVAFGPLNLGLGETEARRRVASALAGLGIADLAERPTHMLSFGQKRRVAIAGALAMRPEVLLLDEPTAGLDAEGEVLLMAALDDLSAAGMTLVLSTHDVDLAYAWADEIAVFVDGRTIRHGPVTEVMADTNTLARARLRPPILLELASVLDLPRPWPRTRDGMLERVGIRALRHNLPTHE
ncbi:cobalt ABC transporter ATP-binding protein [Skermanella stibiiresistens SB22]|uniref:ABC transporter ATP-binding protein n=1 Tax=Skermanella stibiiresistens SB22 TaxID=1385369 RepID=W9H6D6_9PROT|nr:ATP-binding cassette domain-containing protein [Skermanella stibiiresistens]EWY40257.1 cobalt ABC transporter ATP-binding protein [Skermanella stibiiresistens SB22]